MSNIEEAKEEVSLILQKITQRDEDYFLDGIYCRWGRVERDLWAVLERHPTPLAPDGADVCHIVTHVFIDGTCAMCGVPEPRPAGKA